MNKEIKKKEKELFIYSVMLKDAYMELSKKRKNFKKCRELQKEQDNIYNKQQFYSKLIKEMEKEENE